MKKQARGIGFIGFGELGRQVERMLAPSLSGRRRYYFDDILYAKKHPRARPFDEYSHARHAALEFYVGIGYCHLEKKCRILGVLKRLGRRSPAYVHPSCWVDPSAFIGAGAVLFPGCVVGPNARIGEGVLLHQSVAVSHDVSIGDGSYVSPGAVLCGHASTGEGAFLGAACAVSNHVRIGKLARIGIGSVVTCGVPDRASAIGNPLKVLRRPLALKK